MKQFVSRARLAALRGDHDAAIRIYRQAITTHPEIAWMYRTNLNHELSEPGILSPSVVFGMATIPERSVAFLQALRSICFQADVLNIYIDGPDTDYKGPALQNVDIRLAIASKSSSLRDNGKFLRVGTHGDCYFFTVDDDIIYPPNYVEVLIEAIERYGRRAIVGVHGITLPMDADRYFCQERSVLHFERSLEKDTAVNFLGTGTLAFHTSTVEGLSLKHFPYTGMADVFFAAFCRERHIPLVAVARRDKWLHGIHTDNISLFQEFRNADTLQSDLIQRYRPWGKQAIHQAIENALRQLGNSITTCTAFRALISNLQGRNYV